MSCVVTPVVRSLLSAWVYFTESITMSNADIQIIQKNISNSQIMKDLENKQENLRLMEHKMERDIESFLQEAKDRKGRGDTSGARQKLMEKRSLVQQLDRLRASQNIIAVHLGTMRGAELNQTLISTLKASNNAIRSMVPGNDISQIEDFMFDLEDEVKKTSHISDVLAKPISPEQSSSMYDLGQGDLERELEELLNDDERKESTNKGVSLPITGGIPETQQPQPQPSKSKKGKYPLPKPPTPAEAAASKQSSNKKILEAATTA